MPKSHSQLEKSPRRKCWLRLFSLLLAGLAGALLVERWRGQRALSNWKNEMSAKGEIFDAQRLWPPASETHLEFSNGLAQAIAGLRGKLSDYAGQLSGIIVEQPGSYWRGSQERRPPRRNNDTPTNTWRNFDELIQQSQPSLQALRELMRDPPPTLGRDIARDLEEGDFVPSLVGVRVGAQTLQAAAINHLHHGNLEQAVQDLGALLAFAKLGEQDPSLVNYMIRMAIIGLSIDVCWDALQADGWTEPQLASFQQACLDLGRLLPQMARTAESERACRLYELEWFRSHSYQSWLHRYQELSQSFGMGQLVPERAPLLQQWVFHPLWTFAWADQEELEYLRQTQREVESLRGAAQQQSWLRLQGQLTAQYQSYRAPVAAWRFYGALPLADRLSVVVNSDKVSEPVYPYPDFTRAWFTSLKSLTLHQMVITAIALKRYDLRHGQPPANLAALAPEFLSTVPTDLMDGQPLRYQRNANGSFVLYSVGENLRDDGGDFVVEPTDNHRWQEQSPWSGRDWVWPQSGAGVKHTSFQSRSE